MESLPKEIIHIILSYDGKIKYRNGNYMNQISQDDVRYRLFDTIPKPKTYLYQNPVGFSSIILFTNKSVMVIATQTILTYGDTILYRFRTDCRLGCYYRE
jgi:hypothetical protein